MTLLEELLKLEETLLRLDPACDHVCREAMLAEGFEEFGASGLVWSRREILCALEETQPRDYALQNARCIALADDTALLTYRVRIEERETLRSSLWIHRDDRWQMLFHQGTPVPKHNA